MKKAWCCILFGLIASCGDDAAPEPARVMFDSEARAACPELFLNLEERPDGCVSTTNRSLAPLSPSDLSTAFPETVGDWRRVIFQELRAGHRERCAANARAVYEYEEGQITIDIDDMIYFCTGAEGSGDRMVNFYSKLTKIASTVEVAGHSAVRDSSRTRLWISDRCRVQAIAIGTWTNADVDLVLNGLNFESLETACARR